MKDRDCFSSEDKLDQDMAEGKTYLEAERSMMFANCRGEVERMSLWYLWETCDLRSELF